MAASLWARSGSAGGLEALEEGEQSVGCSVAVDTVFIDGVPRKRAGDFVGVDRRALVDDVTQAMADLNARVGTPLHG